MKKIWGFSLLLIALSVAVISCKKDSGGSNGPSLTISLSKSTVYLATPETVTITVKDENNADVTSSCTITVNSAAFSGTTYNATASGSFDFVATKGTLTSNTANLIVIAPTIISADSLTLVFSKDTIEYNDFDTCGFTVYDNTGTNVTSSSRIFVNSTALTGFSYTAASLANVSVFALNGAKTSKTKTLYVKTATPSPFSRKLLVEDCTGTWCGFCPRVANALDNYTASKPNCIVITMHGGQGSSDPYQFQYISNFMSTIGAGGTYPTAYINRYKKWDETTNILNTELAKWAPLGLAIESSTSGSNITGKVKIKYNVTTSKAMKVVVALVENGLIYNQTNYYSPSGGYSPSLYGGANPIVGFVHNGVMRKTSTDLYGDAIPTAQQVKNNIYELPFSFTTSGTLANGGSYNANAGNCSIVAFVMDATTAKKGVYNVQRADVGTTKNFD